jgi:hypothetical protein
MCHSLTTMDFLTTECLWCGSVNHTTNPHPGGPDLRICDPQRQGDPAIPQTLGTHFSRLLRHAWATLGLFLSSTHHTETLTKISLINRVYSSVYTHNGTFMGFELTTHSSLSGVQGKYVHLFPCYWHCNGFVLKLSPKDLDCMSFSYKLSVLFIPIATSFLYTFWKYMFMIQSSTLHSSPHLVEPDGSSPCSQEPTSGGSLLRATRIQSILSCPTYLTSTLILSSFLPFQ